MNRQDFEKWLEKNCLDSNKIAIYKRQLHKLYEIAPQIFDIELEKDLFSLYGLYTEYSNKEYLLDRVTIGTAVNYFREIQEFITPSRWEKDLKTVDVYIYYVQGDFFVQSVSLCDLANILTLLAGIIVKDFPIKSLKQNSFTTNVYDKVTAFAKQESKDNFEDIAIHIKYKNTPFKTYKNVIREYLNYSRSEMRISDTTLNTHPQLYQVKSKNPKIQDPQDRYIVTKPLTGNGALQIRAGKTQTASAEYVLLITDVVAVLNISLDSAYNRMDDIKHNDYNTKCPANNIGIKKRCTILRSYYSILDTNAVLIKGHSHGKEGEKGCFFGERVNYNREGYKFWCRCQECLKILGIRKTSFYHINNIIRTKLSYTRSRKGWLYYKPEIRYLRRILDESKSINKQRFIDIFIRKINKL